MNKHLSQFDTIRIGAQETIAAERAEALLHPAITRCPFCGEEPPLAAQIAGKFVVACENEDCAAQPQVSDLDLSRVWAKWNRRAT